MDEYKIIAAKNLMKIVGKDWIKQNINDICTWFFDNDISIRIVFALVTMLPSEAEVIDNKDSNYQPVGSISFDIDKKSKTCMIYKNLLP